MPDAMTRRTFLGDLSPAGALGLAGPRTPPVAGAPRDVSQARAADEGRRWKGSALGSLYPFVKQQQQRTRQSLAFLNRRPKDLEQWKAEARERVVDLLSYRPEACEPGARRLVPDEALEQGVNDRSRLEPEPTIKKINGRAGESEGVVFRNIIHSG